MRLNPGTLLMVECFRQEFGRVGRGEVVSQRLDELLVEQSLKD